jgi:hypothetical protein
MLLRALLVASLLLATAQAADTSPSDAEATAIAHLPALIGSWEGDGWMRTGPGDPQRFVSQERVEPRLEGRALIIEGKHYNQDRTRIVHNALAVVTYDPASGEYYFLAKVAGQPPGDYRGHLDSDAFIWEMPTPRGKIRYTIRVVNEQWIEKGEIEGSNGWQQFFEMTLKHAGAQAAHPK